MDMTRTRQFYIDGTWVDALSDAGIAFAEKLLAEGKTVKILTVGKKGSEQLKRIITGQGRQINGVCSSPQQLLNQPQRQPSLSGNLPQEGIAVLGSEAALIGQVVTEAAPPTPGPPTPPKPPHSPAQRPAGRPP